MPSQDKRVNLTLDRRMLRLLDDWAKARGYRHRATAVYAILWDTLVGRDAVRYPGE